MGVCLLAGELNFKCLQYFFLNGNIFQSSLIYCSVELSDCYYVKATCIIRCPLTSRMKSPVCGYLTMGYKKF
jgi:hypothetical protein